MPTNYNNKENNINIKIKNEINIKIINKLTTQGWSKVLSQGVCWCSLNILLFTFVILTFIYWSQSGDKV